MEIYEQKDKTLIQPLVFNMYLRNYEDAPFTRNVSFMKFGDYPADHLKLYPKQGFGPVLFTTMDPEPGVMVVDYLCSSPKEAGQCDVSWNESYYHNISITK
jgi:hypothetical protein